MHLGDDGVFAGVDLHLDRRARRTVLDGIADQIRDRLRETVRVPIADRFPLAAQLQRAVLGRRVEFVEDLAADAP